MPDLFDTIFPSGPEISHPSRHAFGAALGEYVAGKFSRNVIINKLITFGLDATGESQMNDVFDTIDGLANLTLKFKWVVEFAHCLDLAESGWAYHNKADFKTRFGIS